MSYLYLDTTHILRVGLLADNFEFLASFESNKLKSSSIIHGKIFEMLNDNSLSVKDLKSIIYVAGPGSYTGMRLSEGIGQILNWQGYKTNSFFHFEVPKILGIKKGNWFSEAFKGEYFCFSWDGENEKKELISKEEIVNLLNLSDLSLCFTDGDLGGKIGFELNSTNDLIKKKSSTFFKHIIDLDFSRPTMYYRSEDKEFKTCK